MSKLSSLIRTIEPRAVRRVQLGIVLGLSVVVAGAYACSADVQAETGRALAVLDLDLRQQMSIAARKASSDYAIERVTEMLLGHYQRLVRDALPRKSSWRTRLRGFFERFSSS